MAEGKHGGGSVIWLTTAARKQNWEELRPGLYPVILTPILGTHFPPLGSSAKGSSTSPNSATCWRPSLEDYDGYFTLEP